MEYMFVLKVIPLVVKDHILLDETPAIKIKFTILIVKTSTEQVSKHYQPCSIIIFLVSCVVVT